LKDTADFELYVQAPRVSGPGKVTIQPSVDSDSGTDLYSWLMHAAVNYVAVVADQKKTAIVRYRVLGNCYSVAMREHDWN
jgi:hypothetical protein